MVTAATNYNPIGHILYYSALPTIKQNASGYMTTGHGQTTNQGYGLKRRIDKKKKNPPTLSAHRISTILGIGNVTTDRHTGTPPYMRDCSH